VCVCTHFGKTLLLQQVSAPFNNEFGKSQWTSLFYCAAAAG